MTDPTRTRQRLLALAAEAFDVPYTYLFDQAAIILGRPMVGETRAAFGALCDAVVGLGLGEADPAVLNPRVADALSRLGVAP